MNRKTVAFRIPIKRDMLDDNAAIAGVVSRLLTEARLELDKAAEGRPCQIDEVRIAIGKDITIATPGVRFAVIEVTTVVADE